MATSVFMAAAADCQTTNPNSQDHAQDQNLLPIRRSSGRRRKSKGTETSSSMKKTPQRGMGVEKLERLRVQEDWRKMREIDHQPFADPTILMMNNASSAPPVQQFSRFNQNTTSNYLSFHGEMGFPNSDLQFGIKNGVFNDSAFLGKNGFSKELSSIPNSVNCYSQHCNACHKKKRVNVGDYGLLGLNIKDNHNIIKEEITTKVPLVGYAVGKGMNQGVEVVAVHRKGSNGSEGGRVVMEYEFFPSSEKGDTEFIPETSCSSSSITMDGFDASSCVDLSLKLSY